MPRAFEIVLGVILTLLVSNYSGEMASAEEAVLDDETKITWELSSIPDVWENLGGGQNEAYHWFRCLVSVPESWDGRQLELFVEAVDDAREVYFNGQSVGNVGTFPPEYRSGLGASLRFPVKPGMVVYGEPNVVAIRVYHNANRIGFNVAAPVLFAAPDAIRMNGPWEHRAGDDLAWSKLSVRSQIASQAVFAEVDSADKVERILKQIENDPGPLALADSMKQLRVPDDLVLDCVVAEPHVCQPLSFKWDERGRLWVVQYLQYPNPAGLTMISRDKYLRAVYDKIPAPPPNHFHGDDKITIHEDTDGDGIYDQHQTFVDGLSLVTSFARGRGGVWVLNPPYLLFYADRDGDDKPDGDPEVHLEGFGLEDSHSLASNIRWGPDGWLYAAQGSTVSGNVRRFGSEEADTIVHTAGQLIWRYHPETRRYEVFAEGGGNTFGVEFDARGRIFSGHNGGDTRGFHYVQGGYYKKGFGKHGALSNPYAFGYFPWMAHHAVPRFTHSFVIYEGGALPEGYHGRLFGVGPLQSHVVMSTVEPDRSSFKTTDVGFLLESNDAWFRPVDIHAGPDGSIYVADMYEQRIDHASHYQGRIHRESGRIYRFRDKNARPSKPFDLAQQTTEELVDLLRDENKWFRQTALRLLGDRRDATAISQIRNQLSHETGQFALELLWALHLSGGLTEEAARETLRHRDPYVRLWTMRLLCDAGEVSDTLASELAVIAGTEPDLQARSQWACSARRLPPRQAIPIVANLLRHNSDAADIHIPLLLWWAIETHVDSDPDAVLALFSDAMLWEETIVAQHLQGRLMRRFAQAGSRRDLLACARLLDLAPSAEHSARLLAGFEEAFQGRSLSELPDELVRAMAKSGGGSLALRLRQEDPVAIQDALAAVVSRDEDVNRRVEYIRILGDLQLPNSSPVLLQLARDAEQIEVRRAALTSLQSFDDPKIGAQVVKFYGQLPAEALEVAQMLLASRRLWASELLNAVDQGEIAADSLGLAVVRRMLLHRDTHIESAIRKHWGNVQSATTNEMFAEIDCVNEIIHSGSGIPHHGKALFMQSCGKCHTLFMQGGNIGPDLTAYQRDDLRRMLVNVINPSLEIREGFENFVIYTEDGLTLNGFITDEDNRIVVLKTADGQSVVIPKDEIEERAAVGRSLMPEGALRDFSDQQIRDLFSYLRASQPVP